MHSLTLLVLRLLTIVSSTAAIQKLAQAPQKSASVNALLLDPEYEMYWVTSSVNFLLGLLAMTVMIGLRLWVSFGRGRWLGKVGLARMASASIHSGLRLWVS